MNSESGSMHACVVCVMCGVCAPVCMRVFNRDIATGESINSSSKSFSMRVGVEIHILVIFFLLHKRHFFQTSILRAKKGGRYISVKCLEEEL